jgi:hypothetical protein
LTKKVCLDFKGYNKLKYIHRTNYKNELEKLKEIITLKLSVIYQCLLWLVGIVVILWGLYQCYPVISTGILITSGPSVAYYFTRMSYLPFSSLVFFAILYEGLGYIGVGVLLLGLSTLRAGIAYWSLHIALWMSAIALWYHLAFLAGAGVYDNLWPFHTSALTFLPWFGGAFLCSFILTGLHGRIQRFLQQLFASIAQLENMVETGR